MTSEGRRSELGHRSNDRDPSLHHPSSGPYANAILRFQIDFPPTYPDHPPIVTILNDVFHPLVTPLTTYSYGTRDLGAETSSATDAAWRLPPGGLSLRDGFPEWFGGSRGREGGGESNKDESRGTTRGDEQQGGMSDSNTDTSRSSALKERQQPPLALELLHYIRLVFSTEALIDAVPLAAAPNASAWHAWRSYRSRTAGITTAATTPQASTSGATDPAALRDRSASPTQQRQQPGGARRPGEWNWTGVWEERVRKSVHASVSEHVLFGGDGGEVIAFEKMDREAVEGIMPGIVGEVPVT